MTQCRRWRHASVGASTGRRGKMDFGLFNTWNALYDGGKVPWDADYRGGRLLEEDAYA